MTPEAIATWVVAGLGLLALLATIVKLGWRNFRRLDLFLDDWEGIPARPGVPEQQGVMARLRKLEDTNVLLQQELNYNHGSSLKDAVHRIDRNVQQIQAHNRGED